jgi:hypothetical protein
MTARPHTSDAERGGTVSTERLSTTRSLQATDNACQKGGASSRRLSRLHCAGGVVHMNHVVKAAPLLPGAVLTLPTLLNWRGLRSASFSRITHRLSLPAVGERHGRLPLPQAFRGARHPIRSAGCTRARAISGLQGCTPFGLNLQPHKLLSYFTQRLHPTCLSSVRAFAGTQPSEAANGRVPKHTGAFHRKKGELPNVCG